MLAVTNLTLEDGSQQWLVESTNGITVGFQSDSITIQFALDHSITVWFDHTNRVLMKTLIEKADCYVRDMDADGISDLRISKTDQQKELWFGGAWYSREMDGTNTLITADGKRVSVTFDGARWSAVE